MGPSCPRSPKQQLRKRGEESPAQEAVKFTIVYIHLSDITTSRRASYLSAPEHSQQTAGFPSELVLRAHTCADSKPT